MDWTRRIVCSPDTLFGRPRIAGTRIGVDLLLDLLASGWTHAEILNNYPQLTSDDLLAAFAFLREGMRDYRFVARERAQSWYRANMG